MESIWVFHMTKALSRPHRDLFSNVACRIVMPVTTMHTLLPIPHAVIRVERPWQQNPGPMAKA